MLKTAVETWVDDSRVELSKTFNYKRTMFSGIPNFGITIGYTNASWTLKAELSSLYVCRLRDYTDRRGWRIAILHLMEGSVG